MFDYFLGNPEEISANERSFLIAVKQLLPKAICLLPDSEYLAIYDSIIDSFIPECTRPVFVETGVGASTVVLAFCAAKYGGHLFSWDLNHLKGSILKLCLADQIASHFQKEVSTFWTFISHTPTQGGIGIQVLRELDYQPVYAFFDGEHTWDALENEITQASTVGAREMLLAIDDGNYTFSHLNEARVNIGRRRLGLPPLVPEAGNIGEPFYRRTDSLLRTLWPYVKQIDDTFKCSCADDPYYRYYAHHHALAAELKLQTAAVDENRFSCWRVARKIETGPRFGG